MQGIDVELQEAEARCRAFTALYEAEAAWGLGGDAKGHAYFKAARAAEDQVDDLRKERLRVERARDRYAKAETQVLDCGRWFSNARTEDGCARTVAVLCGKVGCPNCMPRRAREVVEEIAPKLAELDDVRVMMFSLKNSDPGRLAQGVDQLLDGFNRLRRSQWWKARFNAGVVSLEVTIGRPAKLLAGDEEPARGSRAWHPHLHVIAGNWNYDDARPESWSFPDECGCRVWPCAHIKGRKDALALEWKKATKVDYAPIVWIDRPYYSKRHAGKTHKIYVDVLELNAGDEAARANKAATTEALKYVTKGLSEVPRGMVPELVRVKETRRWMQTFGFLHRQGQWGCRACRNPEPCAKCRGALWSKRKKGTNCACCGAVGMPAAKVDPKPTWECEHGHAFAVEGITRPSWEELARISGVVGLLLPHRKNQKTGPPSNQPRLAFGGTNE